MKTKVVFLPIKETSQKLFFLCQIVKQHFEKKEAIQIIVPDQTASDFVDKFLWKFPEEGFLPHAVNSTNTNELIIISCEKMMPSQTAALFNLLSEPIIIPNIKLIYDFDDRCTFEKKELSDKRFQAYKDAGYSISSQ